MWGIPIVIANDIAITVTEFLDNYSSVYSKRSSGVPCTVEPWSMNCP